MPLTHAEYYHGSPENTLKIFNLDNANIYAPFGPAIYLTTKRDIAREYTGKDGTVYSVSLFGRLAYTINLNATFDDQTIEVQKILKNIFPSVKNLNKFVNVREIIVLNVFDLQELNETLVENGIWMVYGELYVEECCGEKDYGIQYAVLNCNNLSIIVE